MKLRKKDAEKAVRKFIRVYPDTPRSSRHIFTAMVDAIHRLAEMSRRADQAHSSLESLSFELQSKIEDALQARRQAQTTVQELEALRRIVEASNQQLQTMQDLQEARIVLEASNEQRQQLVDDLTKKLQEANADLQTKQDVIHALSDLSKTIQVAADEDIVPPIIGYEPPSSSASSSVSRTFIPATPSQDDQIQRLQLEIQSLNEKLRNCGAPSIAAAPPHTILVQKTDSDEIKRLTTEIDRLNEQLKLFKVSPTEKDLLFKIMLKKLKIRFPNEDPFETPPSLQTYLNELKPIEQQIALLTQEKRNLDPPFKGDSSLRALIKANMGNKFNVTKDGSHFLDKLFSKVKRQDLMDRFVQAMVNAIDAIDVFTDLREIPDPAQRVSAALTQWLTTGKNLELFDPIQQIFPNPEEEQKRLLEINSILNPFLDKKGDLEEKKRSTEEYVEYNKQLNADAESWISEHIDEIQGQILREIEMKLGIVGQPNFKQAEVEAVYLSWMKLKFFTVEHMANYEVNNITFDPKKTREEREEEKRVAKQRVYDSFHSASPAETILENWQTPNSRGHTPRQIYATYKLIESSKKVDDITLAQVCAIAPHEIIKFALAKRPDYIGRLALLTINDILEPLLRAAIFWNLRHIPKTVSDEHLEKVREGLTTKWKTDRIALEKPIFPDRRLEDFIKN